MIIDSHHHFWDPARADYPWMTAAYSQIQRRFGPEDLRPLLAEAGVSRSIVVQARMELEETEELLRLAATVPFIAGVVGWVDLTDQHVDETIACIQAGPGGQHLVGLRHVVHDEDDSEWLLRPEVQRGLAAVDGAGLTYDLLVRPRELPAAVATAERHPGMRFVIDHLGNPPIGQAGMREWSVRMAPFAQLPHVYCKVSGLATQANTPAWRPGDLKPSVQRAMEWFGDKRLMVGSDWPVSLLAGSYRDVMSGHIAALGTLTPTVRSQILHANAVTFYGLDRRTDAGRTSP